VTTCANCNRSIGNLEITQQHEGHVVCNECKALLSVPKAQAAKQKDVWERHIMSAGFEKTLKLLLIAAIVAAVISRCR